MTDIICNTPESIMAFRLLARRERVKRLIDMNRRQDDRKITFDEFTKYCDKMEA